LQKGSVVERIEEKNGIVRYVVPVAGHYMKLRCNPGISCCGHIENGISFEFGNEGGWVIDLDDLSEILRLAIEFRERCAKNVSSPQPAKPSPTNESP
jgi:hypothetical protein